MGQGGGPPWLVSLFVVFSFLFSLSLSFSLFPPLPCSLFILFSPPGWYSLWVPHCGTSLDFSLTVESLSFCK